jgi:hypothetical protein
MNAFQREMLERLTRIETPLTERCAVRGGALKDVQARVSVLEAREHRRKGGFAVMGGLFSAAGMLGGLAAKFWPWGQG